MKFGLEEELIMRIMKTSITQIWMVCHLLLFAKVGQHTCMVRSRTDGWATLTGQGNIPCNNIRVICGQVDGLCLGLGGARIISRLG